MHDNSQPSSGLARKQEQQGSVQADNSPTALLKKVLLSVLQAAEGQEKSLDAALADLRIQLKQGAPKASTVSQLAQASAALGGIRRARADKQLRGFSACVAQLLKLNPPDEVRKELAAFIRHARKHMVRPEEQELMSLRLSRAQGKALEVAVSQSDNPDQEADLSAVSSQDVEQEILEIEALYEDDSLEGLPPYKTVAEAIEDILGKLLAEIHVPEEAQEAWEAANQLLGEGLNWYELAALLEQVALVVQYSLRVDQQELELFLQDLSVRLQMINGGVEGIDEVSQTLQSRSDSFDADLRQGISSMADNIKGAASLDVLKNSVLQGMDSVISHLDDFQTERQALQQRYSEQIDSLNQRISELEVAAEEANKELESQQRRNETDELTGLPNRSAYDRMAALEMARWQRYQQGFCLVVADIDLFKSINDKYGHLAGDKVLSVVAKTIRKRLRRVDFIARYGGEEFVLLLPATGVAEALALMEKLGKEIRECPFHYNKSPLQITVSFGIAEVGEQDSLETLFTRADTALYKAKASGRDRAEVGSIES